ncbi:MAG: imidazolonepropionase [Gemmatimonadaceae bacterium]|nr:imidazolonepropionase [Gemmatimonadaceae bacterium]
MRASLLIRRIGALVSPAGQGAQRGAAFGDLVVGRDAEIAIVGDRIVHVGPSGSWRYDADAELDAAGAAVVPGLVDPHTHVVWGGDRLDDFEARIRGDAYEAILARGGGIRHTMRATGALDEPQLVAAALPRLRRMLAAGATTIECKSGYGIDAAGELRQLRAVRALDEAQPAALHATLLFHVPPTDAASRRDAVDHGVRSLVPHVAELRLASSIDVFVEREAWTVDEARALAAAARANGLGVHLHVDQFHAIGGVELGVELGALSVDHLEASGEAQVRALASSTTVAVLLPGVTLHLGLPAAPARALAEAGAIVALASDCNPGSSPVFSMALVMALACRLYRLTPAQALVAATANAAAALGVAHDTGRLAPGMRADLLLLRSRDWRDLPYTLGDDVIATVIAGGAVVPA